jgi:pyruvate dehydrogenase E2 component (dihydrolipoamide acetyltransferase)
VAAKLALELGVDLEGLAGTGPGGQVTTEDVRRHARVTTPGTPPGPTRRVLVAPRARERARALGVDLTQIAGTGQGGMITTRDVQQAAAQQPAGDSPQAAQPYSRRRQAIARRMQESKQTVPHFYVSADVNMAEAQRLRAHCVAELRWERPPTYTDLFVRASALALAAMPAQHAA